MFHKTVSISLFLFAYLSTHAQSDSPTSYRSPLDIPLELSANFGEIRPDHFHMGIDLKTKGKEGLNLYAIQNGFVSRIKVSPDGYGKSIYIDHPDGNTSVYAHCSEFKGKIDSITKVIQQQEENFEVDIYLRPQDIPIRKGEVIALSGNTGHSFAPHLHFEIRDTKTSDALNPLLFGFNVQDHKKPEIRSLKIYALTEDGYVVPGKSIEQKVIKGATEYSLEQETVVLPESYFEQGPVGLSLVSTDQFDKSNNSCGIYSSSLTSNGKLLFSYCMDRVSFQTTRYVNDHVDIGAYIEKGQEYQKLFKSKSTRLEIYDGQMYGGIRLLPGETTSCDLTIKDAHMNSSRLSFKLKRASGESQKKVPFYTSGNYFLPDSAYSFQDNQHLVNIAKNTFYQPVPLSVSFNDGIRVADANQSIQLPVEIAFKLEENLPDPNRYYISRTTRKGGETPIPCKLINGWLYGTTKNTGSFHLRKDTNPPKITASGFSAGEKINQTYLKWKVSDVSTEISSYDLFIDGKWHLVELEKKGGYLLFKKPYGFKGKKIMELRVSDQCGNTSIWKGSLEF
jgi:hypothetical protein